MSNITLKEIQERKKILEEKITELCRDFEEETGVGFASIEIRRRYTDNGSSIKGISTELKIYSL
jgi:hypothetical protein